MGENFVLGNREDQNEFKPYKLDPRMFEEKKVLQMACGTQHVVALIQDSDESEIHQVDHAAFVKVNSQFPAKPPKKENEEEKVLISSVFHNRLKLRMKLQTDPTIIYGLLPNFNGDITRKNLRIIH